MENNYQLAIEIRREVEEVKERYAHGYGANGKPLDQSNERYEIEDAIKRLIDQAFGRAGWTTNQSR